jgi:mevalonate kinase
VSDATAGLTAFGPGKVILLGEHGVVYGHPALAAPLSRGVRAVATPSRTARLTTPPGLSAPHAAALKRAFARAAALAGSPRVSVAVSSDLPVSMGLGSSGALAVAVSRVLLCASRGRAPGTASVERLALAMEREFHGTPSGVDHTTSARNAMIVFRKGRVEELVARKPIKVLIALVGPRAPTRQTVGALRERQARWRVRYRRLFTEVGQLVEEGVTAAVRGDLEALGDVMNFNQGLLGALGLSSEPIETMVHRLRGLGALGAKLTGAGGDGGAVLGLFPEPQRALILLREVGVTCFESQLAGPRAY